MADEPDIAAIIESMSGPQRYALAAPYHPNNQLRGRVSTVKALEKMGLAKDGMRTPLGTDVCSHLIEMGYGES